MAARAVVCLDAYGTLLSFENLSGALKDAGIGEKMAAELLMAQTLRDFFACTIAGQYETLENILERSVTRLLFAHPDSSVRQQQVDRVMAAFGSLSMFPDGKDSVAHFHEAEKIHLVLLTNGSRAKAQSLLDQNGISKCFDAIFCADDVQKSKPHPAVYNQVKDHFKDCSDFWLVSSNNWDCMGAAAVGFKTAWIDRAQQAYTLRISPTLVVSSLTSAAHTITACYPAAATKT